MNLEKYQEISGVEVSSDEQTFVTAQIRRAQKTLETMLGFTLDPKKINQNLYKEAGKTATECPCPPDNYENLLPADEVVGAYRLYDYAKADSYMFVDPFTKVNAVKLVFNDITLKTFDVDDFRAQMKQGWGKFIENCQRRLCWCDCNCVQLAVDADWADVCKITDIYYVWADMVTYLKDCKKDVKSESIGSHSYTKFDRDEPQFEVQNMMLIKKFAGPNGSVSIGKPVLI